MTSPGMCAALGAGSCGAVAARRTMACGDCEAESTIAVCGAWVGGGRSLLVAVSAGRSSGAGVAWANCVSGDGLKGTAEAFSTAGSGAAMLGADIDGASVLAASALDLACMGMLASCSARQSKPPNVANAVSRRLAATTPLRTEPNLRIRESPQKTLTIPQETRRSKTALAKIKRKFLTAPFLNCLRLSVQAAHTHRQQVSYEAVVALAP